MLIIRFLVLCILLDTARGTKNQHAAEFSGLCNLFTLKDAAESPATQPSPPTFAELRAPIYNLNVSVADDGFLKDGNGKYKDVMPGDDDESKLKAWQQHVSDILNTKHGNANNHIYAKLTNRAKAAAVRAIIGNLLQEADELEEKYTQAHQTALTSYNQAHKDILTAIYGTDSEKYTEGDFTSTRNSCGPGNNGNAAVGKKLLDDMICLCTNKASADATECGGSNAPQVDDGVGTKGENALSHVIALCKKPKTTKALSPELIEAQLTIFHGLLGRQPNSQTGDEIKYVLGKYSSSQCDGASDKNCVNYATQLTAPGAGIPWENKLREAIDKLKAGEAARATLTHYRQHLHSLALTARHAYETAKLAAETPSLQPAKATEGVVEITETDATCQKKGTGGNCKEGCKWDSDGPNKKCVKDPDHKPPQAEGGEKDSKTGTTNTTKNNNSFPIKTSPLWLAFLLF